MLSDTSARNRGPRQATDSLTYFQQLYQYRLRPLGPCGDFRIDQRYVEGLGVLMSLVTLYSQNYVLCDPLMAL